MKYNVLIIGAGKIGAFFDKRGSKNILTHAHAFTKHKDFKLVGFVDINRQKARKAVSTWGGKAFFTIEEAFSQEEIDIAVVAVPDEFHYEVLQKISQFPLKLVFTEKPLTKTLPEAERIYQLYKKKNIPVAVNYTRRFIPEFIDIRQDIDKNKYGDYVTGTGYYGKGFLHNGSHLIDLLRWFLGEIKSSTIINSFVDFDKNDPSISAVLNFKKKKHFFLQFVDCHLFTVFEIDLLFEKKRILIKNGGSKIEKYEIKENKLLKEYRNLVKVKEIKTSVNKSMFYAVENIYSFLTKGKSLECNLENGYKTIKICLDILNKGVNNNEASH